MQRFSWWGWNHSWGVLALVGSLLRVWQIGASPLWYDETNTAWMAILPFGRMLAATGGDVHPPLYLAIMWVWVHALGVNPWTFRIPSMLFSIAALFVARKVMERLELSPRAILIGTAFMALMPFQIYYAQEGRMYSLLELLALTAFLAALDKRWWLLGLANSGLIWTHNYGAFYALTSSAFGLAVILRERRSKLDDASILFFTGHELTFNMEVVQLVGFNVLALVSYLPWLGVLSSQMVAVKEGWWQTPTNIGSFFTAWHMLFWQYAAPPGMDALAALVSFSLLFYALYKTIRMQEWPPLALAGLVLAVPAMAISVEIVYRPIWLWRSLIGVSVPLYYLVGWALDQLGTVERRLSLGMVGALLAVSILWYYPFTEDTKGDRYDVAAQIASLYQPGDVIMHVDIATYSGFYFGFPRPDAPQYLWPTLPGTLGTLSDKTISALDVKRADLDQVSWRRAFLVWGAGPTITGLEDKLVQQLLAKYPHTTLFTMPTSQTQTGGVWLLTNTAIAYDQH